MKRAGALLLACAAACSIYGSGDDAAPTTNPAADPSADASDAASADETELTNDAPLIDDGGVPDAGSGSVDAEPDQSAPVLPDLIVFLSSTTTAGRLNYAGGLENGDQLCQTLAVNYLPRKFKAWLSGSAISARERIIEKARGRRYRRVDHELVADRAEAMVDGQLYLPITVDERGISWPTDTSVWTGTTYLALPGSSNCVSWTTNDPSSLGVAATATANPTWSSGTAVACDVPRHLYCFEVP